MDTRNDAATDAPQRFFSRDEQLVLQRPSDDWDVVLGDGPVVAAAIHDGHAVRDSLLPHMAFTEAERRRDEDPLTGMLTSVGDVRIRVRASRFQVDLNRPRAKAISTDPADTWGLKVWRGPLPADELETSLAGHDRFYAMVRALMDELLEKWGCVLVLDIHSYNHRRDGADADPAPQHRNPDIDLGVTTLDARRWGRVVDRFTEVLRDATVGGRRLDVRENVRYEGGGYFPEWLYATYGERVCAISLEYKKIYMDEWTAQADIGVVEAFRASLQEAVAAIRGEFLACR
jgi:N-formylglutamate deformylase